MLSSLQMTETKTKTAIPLSEEVQEVLHQGNKIAQRNKQAKLKDRNLLQGLLKVNRLFTRQDALLKRAGIAPRRLEKIFKEELANHQEYQLESNAIEQAVEMAKADGNQKRKPRVEIEHLLQVLLQSPDPLVKATFDRSSLTHDKLQAASRKVDAGSPIRMALYCLRETIEVVFVVLVLVILIKQGLGEFRLIPSESMLPTLQIGDRIVVEKVSQWTRAPQRGDILVFYPPEPEAILKQDPWSVFLRLTGFSGILYDKESRIDTAFIKRVVGLPGETLDVKPGDAVYINGVRLNEPYINEVANSCTFINYCGPIEIPEGHYYMMGDNRNHSADSRYWQFLPKDRVIGRAVFRFYPIDERLGPLDAKRETGSEINH